MLRHIQNIHTYILKFLVLRVEQSLPPARNVSYFSIFGYFAFQIEESLSICYVCFLYYVVNVRFDSFSLLSLFSIVMPHLCARHPLYKVCYDSPSYKNFDQKDIVPGLITSYNKSISIIPVLTNINHSFEASDMLMETVYYENVCCWRSFNKQIRK